MIAMFLLVLSRLWLVGLAPQVQVVTLVETARAPWPLCEGEGWTQLRVVCIDISCG